MISVLNQYLVYALQRLKNIFLLKSKAIWWLLKSLYSKIKEIIQSRL
jgi:hypothetical protein